MTAEQLAKRIEEMPIGPFAFWLGLTDDRWQEVAAARKMIATAIRALTTSEIEELRNWLTEDLRNRNAVIEECARVVEPLLRINADPALIIAAIRALKDKP